MAMAMTTTNLPVYLDLVTGKTSALGTSKFGTNHDTSSLIHQILYYDDVIQTLVIYEELEGHSIQIVSPHAQVKHDYYKH